MIAAPGVGEAGFLLRCRHDGQIVAILHDRIGLAAGQWVGQPFTMLIAPDSVAKALDFFTGIGSKGVQYQCELSVAPVGLPMAFVGLRSDDDIVIAAGLVPWTVDEVIGDLLRINNEQADQIRRMFGEKSHAKTQDTQRILEELTQLNSEFANMQREVTRKNRELAEADERKDMLLGMAAHDLRSPLQAITGFAELLQYQSTSQLSGHDIQCLRYISETSGFMLQLVEDLLEFARGGTGHLTLNAGAVDVRDLVCEAVLLNDMLARPKQITVTAELPDVLPEIVADRLKLMQVLNNVLSNAIKFSPKSTRIAVSVVVDDWLRIKVTDQGPGIPEAERHLLFLPFSRTSVRPTAGETSSGLGLAISKKIVEGHRGRILVDAAMGGGTTFTVCLPVPSPDSAVCASVAATLESGTVHPATSAPALHAGHGGL
jgi:signal transduction histidine kinase